MWLNLTEIMEADKTLFLDSPVSPTGLFKPTVDGFAERFTTAQKSCQEMRHFLPKRSSSAAAFSRPKTAPTQQPAKSASLTAQPTLQPEPRQRSCSAKRHPFLKHQGPRPKIALDPVPQKSS